MGSETPRQSRTPHYENKTGTTIGRVQSDVTAVNVAQRYRTGLCGYVVAPGISPFCDRPALPGSSYCTLHHACCAVAPASPDFVIVAEGQTRAGDTLTTPPPELAWLAAPATPEPVDEYDGEWLVGLDLPRVGPTRDE